MRATPEYWTGGPFGTPVDPLHSATPHWCFRIGVSEGQAMHKFLIGVGALAALAAGPASAQQKSVKIGFVSTFSGPTAVIGNDMRNSFELALDHLGRRMGGLPVEVIYEDDQQRPDVGVQKTQKLVESDRVNFVAG